MFLGTFACLLTMPELIVYKHSFSVSLRFYKFVEHPLSGCACFCAFSCSISTTSVFIDFLTTLLVIAHIFSLLVTH